MAVPTYTTDLSSLNLCENSGTFGEFTNMVEGGTPDPTDQDDVIQGSYLCSAECKLKVSELQSIYADYGSGVTIPTDGAILMWNKFDAGGLLESYANGGVRIVIGATAVNWDAWKIGGVDKTPNPYGGWFNYALNPLARTYDYRNGTGTGTTYQFAGMAIVLTAAGPTKGQPFKIDAIRYGRCTIIIEHGSSGDGYATFENASAKNDANDAVDGYNRWGLFSVYGGGYLWKGRMQIGTTSNACEFEDADAFILIDDVVNCTANFNTIEINNASTIINWTNVIFKALGSQSPGRLVMNHNADLNLDACQFFNMGAFGFGGTGSEFLNCVWSVCGLITVAGGKLNGSQILESSVAANASAINWNVATDPDGYLDDLIISKGALAHHAIEFGLLSPTTMTIRGMTTEGFNAAHAQDDSTFYVARTSGTVTIYVVGGAGNFTYKTAGATVVIVADPVTVKVHAGDTLNVDIQNARVFLKAGDNTGPFPFEETVTIVNSGTTATVTHAGHGMASNDYVTFEGASLAINNGVHQITVVNTNSYTYTMSSAPGSSPTGTIKATFVALTGLTDANGDKSTSRVYPSAQPITGWVRLTPQYKSTPLFGEISSTLGYNAAGVMVSDE